MSWAHIDRMDDVEHNFRDNLAARHRCGGCDCCEELEGKRHPRFGIGSELGHRALREEATSDLVTSVRSFERVGRSQ